MKISIMVCAIAVVVPSIASAEEFRRQFETPEGAFEVIGRFGSYERDLNGGFRHEIIVTPNGEAIPGFPLCFPDRECVEGGRATETVVGFTSTGKHAFLVTNGGVWQWWAPEERFIRLLSVRGRYYAHHQGSGSADGVFGLIPDGGDDEFRGVLMLDRTAGEWVLAEYDDRYDDKEQPRLSGADSFSVSSGVVTITHNHWEDTGEPERTTFTIADWQLRRGGVALGTWAKAFRPLTYNNIRRTSHRTPVVAPCWDECEERRLEEADAVLADRTYRVEVGGRDGERVLEVYPHGDADRSLLSIREVYLRTASGAELLALMRQSMFRRAPSEEPQYATLIVAVVSGDVTALASGAIVELREVVGLRRR